MFHLIPKLIIRNNSLKIRDIKSIKDGIIFEHYELQGIAICET